MMRSSLILLSLLTATVLSNGGCGRIGYDLDPLEVSTDSSGDADTDADTDTDTDSDSDSETESDSTTGSLCVAVDSFSQSETMPVSFSKFYSFTQTIHDSSTLCGPGSIVSLAWEYNGNEYADEVLDVYLKHTTKDVFAGTTDWETLSAGDMVFSGHVYFPSMEGSVPVTFDVPFDYDGTSNLLVAVGKHSVISYSSGCYSFIDAGTSSYSLAFTSDTVDPDPLAPPTATFVSDTKPNTVFTYGI